MTSSTFSPHLAVYGLDAGSNEGISCDNESLHSEFIALISSAASSSDVILEKFDSQYVVYITHAHFECSIYDDILI